MKFNDATETAYKNGYVAGAKEFAERLKGKVAHIPAWGAVAKRKIDNLLEEMESERE